MIYLRLGKWLNCHRAAFSSTWDDMTITSIYNITDEANNRGIKTTIYINGDNKEWRTELFYGNDFKKETNLQLDETIKLRLKTIHENGNELGNHTLSHVSLKHAQDSNIKYEVVRCNELINSITGQSEFTFSYPHGHIPSDPKIRDGINKLFIACRCANYGKNAEQELSYINNDSVDMTALKSVHIGTYPYKKTCDELNMIVDRTIKNSGWLIEYGHGWEQDAWKPVDKKTLLDHYNYVHQKRIWCDTVLNISKYITQREQIKYTLKQISETIYELIFDKVVNNSPITFTFECKYNLRIFCNDIQIPINVMDNIKYFNLYSYNKCVIEILL